MLRSCKYSLIGIQLLVLVHIAHTFVLLTANVEDVKKLARKFVSESLAEKIAEFIAKATEQISTTHVASEENAHEEDSHQVSEENNMYNVGRQGESGAQDILKSREDTLQEKPDEIPDVQSNSFEVTTKTEFENIDIEKDKPEFPRLEGPSRYVPVEPNAVVKQYAYPLEEKKPISKISEEDEKYEKENKQNKYLEDNFVNLPTAATEFVPPIKPRKSKSKGRPYRLLSHVNSNEENEVPDYPRKNDTIDTIFGSNLFQNRAVDLTTRKAVFEFDQYENKNYPKSNFIATSGPVSLPKMPNEKWWEKEIPNDAKRRSWIE